MSDYDATCMVCGAVNKAVHTYSDYQCHACGAIHPYVDDHGHDVEFGEVKFGEKWPRPIPVSERLPDPFDIPEHQKMAAWETPEYLITEGGPWMFAEYRSTGWWRRSRANGEWLRAYPSHWMEPPPIPQNAAYTRVSPPTSSTATARY